MALVYNLVRGCLDNVEDNAGRWQIEGGKVMQRDKHVANYSSVKRISCGTEQQNTAMLWVTLFFLHGAGLSDPDGILAGSGAAVRSLRLARAEDLDHPAIRALIDAAEAAAILPDPAREGRLVMKSMSARQRPRRPE